MAGLERCALLLYGPKGVGKSEVARTLQDHLDVRHVDTDRLVLELLSVGTLPDARLGWLRQVEDAVEAALADHAVVSVEATGAYDTDWLLLEHFAETGVRTVPIWVWAPEQVVIERLRERDATAKVAVSEREARRIHRVATTNARERPFVVTFDTSMPLTIAEVVDAVAPLLPTGCRSHER